MRLWSQISGLNLFFKHFQLYGYKMIFLMYSLSSLDVLLMKTVRLTIIYGSQIDVMLDIHCFE